MKDLEYKDYIKNFLSKKMSLFYDIQVEKEPGLTHAIFGKRIGKKGVSGTYVGQILSGKGDISIEKFREFASYLGVPEEEFDILLKEAEVSYYEEKYGESSDELSKMLEASEEEKDFDFMLKQEFPNPEAYKEAKTLIDYVTAKYKD